MLTLENLENTHTMKSNQIYAPKLLAFFWGGGIPSTSLPTLNGVLARVSACLGYTPLKVTPYL